MSSGSMQRWWLLQGLWLGALAVGCGDSSGGNGDDPPLVFGDSAVLVPDAGNHPDASATDAGPGPGATEAGAMDARVMDSSIPDATRSDANDTPDGTTADAALDAGADGSTDAGDSSVAPDACAVVQCTSTMFGDATVGGCCLANGGDAACGLNSADLKQVSPTSPFTGCMPKEVAQASASSYCGEIWDQVERNGKDNGGLDLKSGDTEAIYDGCCLPSGECGASMREPRSMSGVDLHLGCVAYNTVRSALALPDGGVLPAPTNQPFCNPADGGAVTEGTVPGVPKPVCGCGPDTQPAAGVVPPCLANFPKEVCGRDDPSAATLATIPEFMCGCTATSTLACLKNVDWNVCGTKPITANSPELDNLPEYVCGCGETVPYNQQLLPCLPNVVKGVCGALDVTASTQADLSKLPSFVCGCGNGKQYDTATLNLCLSNVTPEVCGGLAITNGNSPWLEKVPTYRCGCTGASFQQVGCLANTQSNICGRAAVAVDNKGTNSENDDCLTGIAEYVRGCGNNASPTASNPTCLKGLRTIPGCVDTQVDTKGTDVTTDDCLKGVLSYLRGCGDGVATGPTGCLPYAHAFWGCDQVTTSVPNVREYICGCGEGVLQPANPAYPCLSNVGLTVCGAVPVTRAQDVEGVPNTVCGCGDGVVTGANCVRNVPPGVCGAIATCATNVPTNSPYYCNLGIFQNCQDNYGTNANGARGDGIGDTCP